VHIGETGLRKKGEEEFRDWRLFVCVCVCSVCMSVVRHESKRRICKKEEPRSGVWITS